MFHVARTWWSAATSDASFMQGERRGPCRRYSGLWQSWDIATRHLPTPTQCSVATTMGHFELANLDGPCKPGCKWNGVERLSTTVCSMPRCQHPSRPAIMQDVSVAGGREALPQTTPLGTKLARLNPGREPIRCPREGLGNESHCAPKLMDSWAAKNNESWCDQGMNVIADEQTVV